MNALNRNFWKKKKNALFSLTIISLLIISIGFSTQVNTSTKDPVDNESSLFSESNITDQLKTSSSEDPNMEIIDALLNSKLQNFSDLGYFPQRYRTSLQAIYYAINSLDIIGALDSINSSFIIDRVMSFYDNDRDMFIDDYALRYLDTDIELGYYPLTSLLQVNGYALLTLELLSETDLIDTQTFIDFIWSCFDVNTGGFIGQPYSSDLDEFFKLPTADNTYIATLTLDVLGISWNDYTTELDLIINFIDSLQIKDQYNPSYGGFLNDLSYELDTMWFFEPNIHSSYYAIKTLDIIGLADVIDLASFREYLDMLYQDQKTYFVNAYWGGKYPWNFTNIPSTAMGLELSQIVGWAGCDTDEAFNFVKKNRNSLGIWDTSTEEGAYELIDTYQILRSLNGASFMGQFSSQDLESIDYGISLFEQYEGYSLLSREYNSLDLIYTISKTAKLFNRITELDIGSIYEHIFPSYFEFAKTFHSHAHFSGPIENYHSFPIEYCTQGNRNFLGETGVRFGHEATFKALTVLRDLYKLDDFEIHYNLSKIIEEVINSQFLEETYSNFGGFKPNSLTSNPDKANKKVFLKYSYYAIKVLELLSDYLELGDAASLGFDVDALYVYIFNNIVETPQELYYEADYSSDQTVRLENTYYMTYILDAIEHYNLDSSKIENFVKNSLNYESIESIYYTHKLKQLLDLNIQFNISKTQNLVKAIYAPKLHECFLDSNHTEISQGILLWLTEMSLEADMEIYYQHTTPTRLGYEFVLNVSLSNLILNSFGPYHSVKFTSETLGTLSLTVNEEGVYCLDTILPFSEINYPTFSGIIQVFYKGDLLAQQELQTSTEYNRSTSYTIMKQPYIVDLYASGYYETASGKRNLTNSEVYANVYMNESFVEVIVFTSNHSEEYSEFSYEYDISASGNYSFEIYLLDGFSGETLLLCNSSQHYIVLEDMEISYKIDDLILLGHEFSLNVSLSNIIFDSAMEYLTVKFESETLGECPLDVYGDGNYSLKEIMPVSKKNYPNFTGTIKVYYRGDLKAQKEVFTSTHYTRSLSFSITKTLETIEFYVNGSYTTESGTVKLFNSDVSVDVYRNQTLQESLNFDLIEIPAYSEFFHTYNLTLTGNYTFKVSLFDGLSEETLSICEISHEYVNEDDTTDPDTNPDPSPPQDDTGGDDDSSNDDTNNDDNDDSDGNNDDGGGNDNGSSDDDNGEENDDDSNSGDGNSQDDSTQKERIFIALPSLLIPMMTVSSVLLLTTSIYRNRNERNLV